MCIQVRTTSGVLEWDNSEATAGGIITDWNSMGRTSTYPIRTSTLTGLASDTTIISEVLGKA